MKIERYEEVVIHYSLPEKDSVKNYLKTHNYKTVGFNSEAKKNRNGILRAIRKAPQFKEKS